MLKCTIVTDVNFVVLGINGVDSLFKALGVNEIGIHHQLKDVLQVYEQMEAHEFGFTNDFKAKSLEVLKKSNGENCLILSDWFISWEGKREQAYMKSVGFLNEGLSLNDALTKAGFTLKETAA